MAKYYVGQTKLRIRLTMSVNITGGSAKIKYKRPVSKTEGEWTAVIETAATGVIYYDVTTGDIPTTEFGEWLFWGEATFSDGGIAEGEVVRIKFHTAPN